MDTGEYAYSKDEVLDRLKDTAASSALAFLPENVASGGMHAGNIMSANRRMAAQNASTEVDTNPAAHTRQEQTVIDEYQAAVDDNLVHFVESAMKNKGSNQGRYTLKPMSDRAAADIKALTGVDTSGFKTVLEQRIAEHIVDRHGASGAADRSMRDVNDIARMQYVLDNYDRMESAGHTRAYTANKANGKPGQSKTVKYIKAVNGTYYIVEAVPDTKTKTAYIVSAFMSENAKTGDLQTADANAPAWTAKTENAASPVPTPSIASPGEGVNTQSAPDAGAVSGQGANGRRRKWHGRPGRWRSLRTHWEKTGARRLPHCIIRGTTASRKGISGKCSGFTLRGCAENWRCPPGG